MNKLIITAAFASLTACATTGRSLPIDHASTGMAPTLDTRLAGTSSDESVTSWFPALAAEASLPSASRFQRELSTERDRFDIAVRLCVAPDGSVASVDIQQPSGSQQLDAAAARDITAWRFESFKAPAHVRVCKQLALAYEPHAEMSAVRIPLVRTSQP